jgi:hypothetical protein
MQRHFYVYALAISTRYGANQLAQSRDCAAFFADQSSCNCRIAADAQACTSAATELARYLNSIGIASKNLNYVLCQVLSGRRIADRHTRPAITTASTAYEATAAASAFLIRPATISLGWAPFVIHFFTASVLSLSSLVRGL